MTPCKSGFGIAIICLLMADILLACEKENVEKGLNECIKATQETFEEHKLKLLTTDPQKSTCCLMYHLTDCLQYAITEADCSAEDKNMAEDMQGKKEEAMAAFASFAKVSCKDTNEKACTQLAKEFDDAKKEIKEINAGSAKAPSAFLALFLFALVLFNGKS